MIATELKSSVTCHTGCQRHNEEWNTEFQSPRSVINPWRDWEWSFANPNSLKTYMYQFFEEALGDLGSFLTLGANFLWSSTNNHYVPWFLCLHNMDIYIHFSTFTFPPQKLVKLVFLWDFCIEHHVSITFLWTTVWNCLIHMGSSRMWDTQLNYLSNTIQYYKQQHQAAGNYYI